MVPISFEFYPPKTDEQRSQLDKTAARLKTLRPEYVSVTFGAGGSTLSHTPEAVQHLHAEFGYEAVPHITCMGGSREEIRSLLKLYRALGARRLIALRGDLPSGMVKAGELRYAEELVSFIREETGEHFRIEVAAFPETHPQARDALSDLDHFVRKVRAGANGAITQYFYNADAYFRFVDDLRARGVDIPVVPGIMPIANFSQLRRFSDLCGAEIPRWMAQRLQAFGDDARSIREFAADVVAQLCRKLVDGGAPALHFYTLNLARPTVGVLERLGASA
ncbi:MAG TPA: methylenetetrahydrofolate reductase [NAD(P)H] [Lysobacter sp.]|nr:methylenetetrahydrofolate reductase [NAD(P)H] [Lysobacter sp.]